MQLLDLADRQHVGFRNDAADHDANVLQTSLVEKMQNARHQCHVGAAEKTETEPIGIFIGNGPHNGFGRLPQPDIDNFHAGIAKCPGHDLDTTAVTIKAYLVFS